MPSKPSRTGSAGDLLAGPAGFFGIPLAGGAAGALLAVVAAPGSEAALAVGALTLPLGFLASVAAWRVLLGAWLAAILGRSALRSRGNEERFRAETISALGAVRTAGPGRLPFTWVFVPACALVGILAALLLVALTGGEALAVAVLLLLAAVAFGVLLRRLARAGRFPIPNE